MFCHRNTDGRNSIVHLRDCNTDISINGWDIAAIGSPAGSLKIDCAHSKLILNTEANIATGVGCRDAEAAISFDNTSIQMNVNSANGILFGCRADSFNESSRVFDIQRDGIVAGRKRWFAGKDKKK